MPARDKLATLESDEERWKSPVLALLVWKSVKSVEYVRSLAEEPEEPPLPELAKR